MPCGSVHLAVTLVLVPPGGDAALAGLDTGAWKFRKVGFTAFEIVVQIEHHGEDTLPALGEERILG